MILALHIGNTRTVFAAFRGGEPVGGILSFSTDIRETSLGYAARIRQVLDLVGVSASDLTGTVLSCVVPPLVPVAKKALFFLTQTEPVCVGAGVKTGLRMGIDDPGTVGSDLVGVSVAAKEGYPLPCVVIDFETAITFTCLNASGHYVGGAFLPGVEMSLNALASQASLLPGVELIAPKKAIGTSTVECMRSGVLFGTAGAIDGMLDRIERELGEEIKSVVFTGELGSQVRFHCTRSGIFDPLLLLKGLLIIYRKNKK